MNIRQSLYFTSYALKGVPLGRYYRLYSEEEKSGIAPDTTKKGLINLLDHCKQHVPYYSRLMAEINTPFWDDPFGYISNFPILTKELIRKHTVDITSSDITHRKWHSYPSGGSTGKPIDIIQDTDYSARVGAIKLLFSKFAGREIGELEVYLWGSMRDIGKNEESWRANLINKVSNTVFLNAFRMTPAQMKKYILYLNDRKPRLIVAYTSSIYALARFAEQENLPVLPQNSIITSAGVLYPFMRTMIERVFQCRIFNRYGSREVGDIACERPGCEGLWVAPWGNFIEIVDKTGNRVPNGIEGDILITSLSNYAMPLIRYQIGDRGYLINNTNSQRDTNKQILGEIIGRTDDAFKTKDGAYVHPGYFITVLFNKNWIYKYQVIQKGYSHLVFRIVRSGFEYDQSELDEIEAKSKLIMGPDCQVDFEFVDDIPESDSGKFRYLISEIKS